ncbi:hypothetical protein B0I37DRAFT_376721 [Chaetomium sp. MPI-CAGE-AT-0009]|nr:hypothetical protein B0I37DRAFT_376721 [Chaetomium sp. MPI-CAGE-AT-0009]
MRRLLCRLHRHKEASWSPQSKSPRASESSEALSLGVGGSAIHHDASIPVRSGMEAHEVEAFPESPKDHTSPANRGVGVELAFEQPPTNPQSEQFQAPVLTSAPGTGEPTPPQVEPRASLEQAELNPVPGPALPPAPKEQVSGVDTSTNLSPSPAQKCEACDLEHPIVWFCRACNIAFCDECWSKQLPHKKNKPGDVAHEKTNMEIAEKVKNVLTPPTNELMCEKLHDDDELTAWFGIEGRGRGKSSHLVLYDYGRLSEILKGRGSDGGQGRMTPSLASFVGETGAGKSSLIKLLIDLDTAQGQKHSSPIVGPGGSHHPTSEDVHLYLHPRTAQTARPIMMVDCEGLDGGELDPAGAKFRFKRRKEEEKKAMEDKDYFKALRICSEYELQWSFGDGGKTRGFAVTHLYPRLIYAFSDVIVFVLHNARVIEQVFEKLITWAANAIETSANQPLLPHVIIVLNKHEDFESADTSTILEDISSVIEKNTTLSKWANHWRERGKTIDGLSDLVHCYYSSVEIMRIPGKDRPQLVHDRVKELQALIAKSCNEAQMARSRAGMLLEIEGLQTFMHEAFSTFAEKLDSPFDFIKSSLLMSRHSTDFSNNLLQLLRGVVDLWKDKDVSAFQLLEETNWLVASCINLDATRQGVRGTPSDIMVRYVAQLDEVLEGFCNQLWPCEVRDTKTGTRCINTRFGHAKGHQSKNGRVFLAGSYTSTLSFDTYHEEFLTEIYWNLGSIFTDVSERVDSGDAAKLDAAAQVHQGIIQCFFRLADPPEERPRGASRLTSHSSCFCCFAEPGEHPMPCEHVLCTPCAMLYGKRGAMRRKEAELPSCPIGCKWPSDAAPQVVRLKPESAGVRVLSLDGGGIRGLVELETLRQIEIALGGKVPIQSFFDLIVGTSTGGIVALGLGAMGWSVDSCIKRFRELCTEAFTRRKGGILVESFHHSKYQTTTLEATLRKAFGDDRLLFGGSCQAGPSIPAVKVAVTSFSFVENKAVVLSNYNRPWTANTAGRYHFQRPERIAEELKVWEAARATSAAPQYFRKFYHGPSEKTYLDGAILYNNPVEIADQERKAIWPDGHYPDIVLSLGTGHSTGDQSLPARKLTRSKTGIVTYVQDLIELLRMNMDTTLNCDEAWLKYESLIKSVAGHFDAEIPMFRISPTLQGRLPGLDETAKAKDLNERVATALKDDCTVIKVARQLVASSFYFELESINDGYGEKFQATGQICCRLSPRSDEIAGLGSYLRDQTRVESQRPLCIHVSIRDNQGVRREVAVVDLSDMVNRMVENKPCPTLVSFELKHKAAPIEMRLQFGKEVSSSCLISGFPRSLLPGSRPRGRTRSRQTVSGANSSAGSPRHDSVVSWKPPERQDDMSTADIRRYTDPSRKLGHHNVSKAKKQESGLMARHLSLFRKAAPGTLNDASHVAKNRMNPIRDVQVRQRVFELGLDPEDWLHRQWARFFLALRQGDTALAELILMNVELNADINLGDRRGKTLLHIAALVGDEDAVLLLQQHEAKSTRDRDGWLPIDIATREGFRQLFHILSLTYRSPNNHQPILSYPEPTKWADSSNPSKVVISDNGLVAFFADKNAPSESGRQTGALWSVISDHPIPPTVDEYYFEVEILGVCRDRRRRRVTGIGLTRFESMSRWDFQTVPGWDSNWGYHGDSGGNFTGTEWGAPFGPTYGPGDTVGCGVDFLDGTVYYTLNGRYLGVACKGVKGQLYPTAGFCCLGKVRVKFNVTPPAR